MIGEELPDVIRGRAHQSAHAREEQSACARRADEWRVGEAADTTRPTLHADEERRLTDGRAHRSGVVRPGRPESVGIGCRGRIATHAVGGEEVALRHHQIRVHEVFRPALVGLYHHGAYVQVLAEAGVFAGRDPPRPIVGHHPAGEANEARP